jgi:hypothetical protein
LAVLNGDSEEEEEQLEKKMKSSTKASTIGSTTPAPQGVETEDTSENSSASGTNKE